MGRQIDICCTTICLAGLVAALIFCILYTVQAKDEIDYPHHLWYWCVIYGGIIALAIINTIVKLMIPTKVVVETEDHVKKVKRYAKSYVYNYENPLDSILGLAEVGMFIWGCVIYANLGSSGGPYNDHLWTWFQVMFWFLVAWISLTCCMLSLWCLTACLGGIIMGLDGSNKDKTSNV